MISTSHLLPKRNAYGASAQICAARATTPSIWGISTWSSPAALAAARKGLSVALINSRPHVGGNSSEEAGVGFDGAGARHSNMRETGIADEIRRTMDFNRITWQRAEEMLLAAEKTLAQFPNQFVIDADASNGKISSLTTLDCIDCTRRIYRAEYFIDCTGDGWLGYGRVLSAGARAQVDVRRRICAENCG